ncbi:KH domain-containing protein [Trichoderma breve]|uniref:KH domain-containing protein n=1 Tax=Trichoderma breve TaxID=2034170 RepID=A0A9W9B9Y9_9HYPO|nr:KH domain-containing protein [Trichoderma breve]KAJ4857424.1 KH domain-containing protein [Trichoderma breve]
MAEPAHPDIQSILAALASQRPPSSASTQTPPASAGAYPAPPGSAQPASYQPPPPGVAGFAPPGSALPAPASSGNVDLSALRPVNSGTMNFDDVISKARAYATEKGITPYDRPLVYGSEPRTSDRSFRRSRSRSPPRGGGDYHNGSSYRDDRRGAPQGREYRERSYSPPSRGRTFSPRGGAGAGRERSPLRGGDDNSETIQIESSLVGLIIGRQGENLRRIEADTNCRVQFLAATDGGPFRQCKITGPRARRAEVKTAINRIIEDSGMGALNRAQEKPRDPARGGAAALRDGEDHMQIMVPDRTVGLIIGRGGETIRDLQERSGCHINIVGESKSVNGLRPVNLIGSREAAARAKDFIMEIVDSDSRGDGPASGTKKPPSAARNEGPPREFSGGSDKINDAIYVPSDAVGMIIGKGGPGEVQREIALIGTRDSIARAKQAIDEKVEAVRQKSSGSGGPPGGRGRGPQDDRPSYSQQGPDSSTNQPPQSSSADGSDPYAQYGGYQNYVALWYQSLMYQQQQQGGQATPPSGGPPAGAPPPGAQ